MQIKINEKILSIPPYISTVWSQVAAMHMKGNLLAITLNDTSVINIPGLPNETIELIFNYHAAFLEKNSTSMTQPSSFLKPEALTNLTNGIEPNVRLSFGNLEGLGSAMQHNPAQADAPDLPSEMLQKIAAITKIMGPIEEALLPKPEPHCNCFHCQIARAIYSPALPGKEETEEEISEQDLHFEQWGIEQLGDKLYAVTNRLDTQEKYSVYLGEPVGCTCGKQGCEHILAVLRS